MDTETEKVATFHSHYGALVFRKKFGSGCKLAPVPRALSSSCGTAAFFSGAVDNSLIDDNLEAIYELAGSGYRRIYGEEEGR